MRNRADFERLADAMLPKMRRSDLNGGSRVIHRLPSVRVPRRAPSPPPLPTMARNAAGRSPTPKRRPPPLPDRAAIPAPMPTQAPLREGARAERGLSRSSIFFLATIAIAIIAMSIIGLAIVVPHSDWALIYG